jgi:putative two-component system response regulator
VCAVHPQFRVLVVDDDDHVTGLFARLLTAEGYAVEVAQDGPAALQAVADHPPDVMLLDVIIPGLDGFEVCRRLKRESVTRLLPVILVTGLTERTQRIEGLEAGADDFLTKPVDKQELLTRVRSLTRMKRYTDDLDSAAAIVMTLAVMIEARDGHTEGHCHRLANYATALGRRLGLNDEQVYALHRGGFLHDIGMLAVPDAVLRKAGPLTPEEFELVKSHTVVGDALCRGLRSLQPVGPIVRHHHERVDGSGYPDGLCGDGIPLMAQIIAVVDQYDAVTTRRPYQEAKPIEESIEMLRQHVRYGWKQHDLVEEFVAVILSGSLETFTESRARNGGGAASSSV